MENLNVENANFLLSKVEGWNFPIDKARKLIIKLLTASENEYYEYKKTNWVSAPKLQELRRSIDDSIKRLWEASVRESERKYR